MGHRFPVGWRRADHDFDLDRDSWVSARGTLRRVGNGPFQLVADAVDTIEAPDDPYSGGS